MTTVAAAPRALDAQQRSALERFVTKARGLLEDDLSVQAEGRFGLHRSGAVEDEGRLRLDPSAAADRRELVAVVEHLRSLGESAEGAIRRLIREATFTHLNRLVAIRIAEAIGLLPPSLAAGRISEGFRNFQELALLLANDYWAYLRLCGDELAGDAPALFDPRNPLLALAPSTPALDAFVDLFVNGGNFDLWTATDTLGWCYQFFNTPSERRTMRERGAPRDSRELAVRNQFFTPRYVVEFLAHNTLGRRLVEADPSTQLLAEMPFLVDPPREKGASPLELEEVSVLDPACGSGHFLLGCYDLLERAWELRGVPPHESAPSIVASLWGIDIDLRCAQVASAAIMFRARRHCRGLPLPRPNIIVARSLPSGVDLRGLGLQPDQLRLVASVAGALAAAPTLGPLLRAEQELSDEIRHSVFGRRHAAATLPVSDTAYPDIETRLLASLRLVAHRIRSTTAERLLVAEADDALRFLEAMQRRYDVVLMNPPFGEPVTATKAYLRAAYPWAPSTSDLFAIFVGRGLELCKPGGYMGAITSRVGMFLRTFEAWRKRFLFGCDLITLADLGDGVMEQAMVEAAAYVIAPTRSLAQERTPTHFLRAVTFKDKGKVLTDVAMSMRTNTPHPMHFPRNTADFATLSGSPLPYWVDGDIVRILARHPRFEPTLGVVRQGLSTGDNFRFVRAWWEVSTDHLTERTVASNRSSQSSRSGRWAPLVQGGGSQPWYSPLLLVVDWTDEGERLRRFAGAVLRNTELYFRPGFSWTRRAPRLFPYIVPAGCIPTASRYQAFPNGDAFVGLAITSSNAASAFCRFYGENFFRPNFLVDNVKDIPVPGLSDTLVDRLTEVARQEVLARRDVFRFLEPYREFTAPLEQIEGTKWEQESLLGDDLDSQIGAAYGLSARQREQLELDTREALAFFRVDAHTVEDEEQETFSPWGERLLSYVVGAAFGRWDVRLGREPHLAQTLGDPLDDPPMLPPGMLLDRDGMPSGRPPQGYPLSLPENGTLVDEPGYTWDIEARVIAAASALYDNADQELERALRQVGYPTVRQYIRRRFFKDHLATYSKERRKAPLYWPLAVPSRSWTVWIYAQRLTRETLFAIAREAVRRERLASEAIARLRRQQRDGSLARAQAVELDDEERLADELRQFRSEAERIAGLGWEPDLDDGIILCAAPLAGLFPAWPEAQQARSELRDGKHRWASVASWGEAL